jgi:hypothetical protein
MSYDMFPDSPAFPGNLAEQPEHDTPHLRSTETPPFVCGVSSGGFHVHIVRRCLDIVRRGGAEDV